MISVRNFVAGLQQRMPETAICNTMTPNGYRRRQPFSFCPTNTTWGVDNRTVGIRIIEGSPSAVRVEKRDGSADCNPYLMLAADIAAGLDGIEQGLNPTEITTGNGYEDEAATPIPTDIQTTAIGLARDSDFLKGVLGDLHPRVGASAGRARGRVHQRSSHTRSSSIAISGNF